MIRKKIKSTHNRIKNKIKDIFNPIEFDFDKTEDFFAVLHTPQKHHDIVVFSNQDWEELPKRSRYIMDKLSLSKKILFLVSSSTSENPGLAKRISTKDLAKHNIIRQNLDILQKDLSKDIKEQISNLGLHNPVFWFNSPKSATILGETNPSMVVYDCHGENCEEDLILQEKFLLSCADVVFTDNQVSYNNKIKFHDNVYYINEDDYGKRPYKKLASAINKIVNDNLKKLSFDTYEKHPSLNLGDF